MLRVNESNSVSLKNSLALALSIALTLMAIVSFFLIPDLATHYRALLVVCLVSGSLYFLVKTEQGKCFLLFFRESKIEVYKIIWPTKQEAMQSTFIVCALVTVVGFFLWLLDILLFWLVSFLTGQRV
jgi:preprotein translocase subunit SecE